MVERALPLLYGVLNRRSGPVSLRLLSALHWAHYWALDPALRSALSDLFGFLLDSPYRRSVPRPRPYWDR